MRPRRKQRLGLFSVLVFLVLLILLLPFWLLPSDKSRPTEPHQDKRSNPVLEQVQVEVQAEAGNPVHFIVTIGCSEWQLLQATVLEHSFVDVNQRGLLTRLVSGCDDDKEELQERMSQSVYSNISVVFVGGRESVQVGEKKRKYAQANRPQGLKEFFNMDHIASASQDTVYIVIDPDFIFLKPIPSSVTDQVRRGTMVSHKYNLANPRGYASQACVEALGKSPDCKVLEKFDAFHHFFAGVPYMLVREDWLRLLDYWIPLIGPGKTDTIGLGWLN